MNEEHQDTYLNITTVIPKAYPLAEAMTLELYRGFSQHFMRGMQKNESTRPSKNQKDLKFKNFVCEFIEDENGLTYFLQVKAMEFELVEQMSWSPSTTYLPVKIKVENDFAPVCEAQIIC